MLPAAVLAMPLLLAGPAEPPAAWECVFEEKFDNAACLKDWKLEGSADVTVTANGRLQIATRRRTVQGHEVQDSVLWCRRPFCGDVRLEFDCQAEAGSRCLFFFHARATGKEQDIFAWGRPRAAYADYAYEPRLELYTLGILRSDQNGLNLRHLGGDVPEAWQKVMAFPPQQYPARYLSPEELREAMRSAGVTALPEDPAAVARIARQGRFPELLAPDLARYREVNDSFQKASIIADQTTERPVFGDPERVYHVSVTTVGNHLTVEVDGRRLIDHLDAARAAHPLRGGYFAFRNFVPKIAWFDNLRVYRRRGSQ